MKRLFRTSVMMGFLLGAWSAVAHAQAPVLLFTDIITGANSGGEGGNGVYITIYGKNFGATQGSSTVTVGGVAVTQYKIWGSHNGTNAALDKVVVQIGPSTVTGNIVMTVNGQASNALPFTVFNGRIFFVSKTGSNAASGSFAAPWADPIFAKNNTAAGDTIYLRAGIWDIQENFGATLICNSGCSGVAGQWKNILGYPGETAQLGGPGTVRSAMFTSGSGTVDFFTVGELVLRAGGASQTGVFGCSNPGGGHCSNIRLIGNDIRLLAGPSAAIDFELPGSNVIIYGNDSSQNCPSCDYNNRGYSLYLGGNGAQSNFDIGWNALHDNPFGKSIQIYGHSASDSLTNLLIHDNLIYNNTMTGMTLGGCDGGCAEFVRTAFIYNNLIWNNSNGVGSDHMNYGGIQMQGNNSGLDNYQVYNNTFWNNSPAHTGVQAGAVISFGFSGVHSAIIKNNILYGTSGAPCYFYFDDSSPAQRLNVTFSNNLYFNAGTGPKGCNYNVGTLLVNGDTAAVNADPTFVNVNASLPDFHLTLGSPAIDKGMNTGVAMDYGGNSRPQGIAYDIGAYEFVSGIITNRPLPPTNLSVVVQ